MYGYFTLSDWIVYFIKCTLLYYSSFFGNVIVDISQYKLSVINYGQSAYHFFGMKSFQCNFSPRSMSVMPNLLLSRHIVPKTCSQDMLLPRHAAPKTCCFQDMLLPRHAVPKTCCSQDMLLPRHAVPKTSCLYSSSS